MLQSPTGSGKSAAVACLPLLVDIKLRTYADSCATTGVALPRRYPIALLYLFPLEALRKEILLSLQRVSTSLAATLVQTADGGYLACAVLRPIITLLRDLELVELKKQRDLADITRVLIVAPSVDEAPAVIQVEDRLPTRKGVPTAMCLEYDLSMGETGSIRRSGRGPSLAEVVCQLSSEDGFGQPVLRNEYLGYISRYMALGSSKVAFYLVAVDALFRHDISGKLLVTSFDSSHAAAVRNMPRTSGPCLDV